MAHTGAVLCLWLLPTKGAFFPPGLNVIIASGVLFYSASRIRYILAAVDWPYLGLIAFEALVLILAVAAFRGNRWALVGSFVAFGLHALASIAAMVFAFGFKFTKLM